MHSDDQVKQIATSMQRYGVTTPLLVDEQGVLLYGHGRRAAAALLGYATLPVSIARGWAEADKAAYRIWDNQSGLLSEWNIPLLKAEVGMLKAEDYDLQLLGFPELELVEFTTGFPDGAGEGGTDDADRSALLGLINVTIAEPAHKVETGDHYVLEGRHHLLCESVISGWAAWAVHLSHGALFCPYPGVFVPFSTKARKHPLVMVQPDPYIAGHMLDRFAEIRGETSIHKQAPTT